MKAHSCPTLRLRVQLAEDRGTPVRSKGWLASDGECRYHVAMSRVVDWDGKNIPDEMRSLPPGRYLVEPIDEAVALTPEEEEGVRQAMASLEAGQGRSLDEVHDRVLTALKR